MHDGAGRDPEHRREPGAPALVDAAADDVEHGRARDHEQRERREDEEAVRRRATASTRAYSAATSRPVSRDARAQLLRLEHLELRAEAQQLAVGVAEMREREHRAAVRRRSAARPEASAARPRAPAPSPRRGRGPARSRATTRPRSSRRSKPGGRSKRVGERPHGRDAGDAVDAHAGGAARDEVPGAALQHEPERVDRPLHDAGRPRGSGAARGSRSRRRPRARAGAARVSSARNQPRVSRWKRREARLARSWSSCGSAARTLSRAAASSPPSPSSAAGPGDAGREERLRLVAGQPGQAGAVAAREPVAARRAAHRLDGDAGGGERLDVAVHRAHRHLEPLGELRRGQLARASGAGAGATRAGLPAFR